MPRRVASHGLADMIETRSKDGTGDAYVKLPKVYLNQLKESFNCQFHRWGHTLCDNDLWLFCRAKAFQPAGL